MTPILLISPWNKPCGIADYAKQLKGAVEAADAEYRVTVEEFGAGRAWPLVHINYHEAVTAAWMPEHLQNLKALGVKTVVTYHNTFGEHTPEEMRANGDHRLDLLEAFCQVADAVVVHEPCRGLTGNVKYWRQGVYAAQPAYQYTFMQYPAQPILGSLGFPFPWKNYDTLCTMTRDAGWALVLLAPTATPADIQRWQTLNPYLYVRTDFIAAPEAVSLLAGCDATAFLYGTCAYAGTSGAVRFGIAARKPVLLFEGQRQMRDLLDAYPTEFYWADSWADAAQILHELPIQRVDAGMVYVAEQDSWTRLGQKYVQLYRELLA